MTFKYQKYKFLFMKNLLLIIIICFYSFSLKTEVTLKAQTYEEKDFGCITLLKIVGEKTKKAGQILKYEKLQKLQKSIRIKYDDDHFTEEATQLKLEEHVSMIKEKGQRYINKGLQKCGLK